MSARGKGISRWVALACLVGFAVTLVVLVRFWVVLGDRGLEADANGTSGYLAEGELALIVCSLFGLLAFGVAGIVSARRWLSGRRPDSRPDHKG